MNQHLLGRPHCDRRSRRYMNRHLLGLSLLRTDHCRRCLAGNWMPGTFGLRLAGLTGLLKRRWLLLQGLAQSTT